MSKFISFEDVEELASIEQLAQMLGLDTSRSGAQLRCSCPIHGGDARTLAISPQAFSKRGSKGVFFCQASQKGGDRIGLVAHCMDIGQQDAAFFIQEQYGTLEVKSTVKSTSTVSKERATVPPAAFDPEKFSKHLTFSPEVEALGFKQEDAAMLGVGYHAQRKMIYLPLRAADGSVSGYIGVTPGTTLRLPPQWLQGKVVQLRRA